MQTAACCHYYWVNVDMQKHTQGRYSTEKEIERVAGSSPGTSGPEVDREMG